MPEQSLKVNLAGIELANPVVAASGPLGYGFEYAEHYDLSAFGALIVKGVSLEPWAGNPAPRLAETASGMLNAVGLQNPGLEVFVRDYLPALQNCGTRLIVNLVGKTVEEYSAVAVGLAAAAGIDGLELNISCPNLKAGGMAFGTDPALTAEVVGAVRKETNLPLIVKLSPNVTSITEIAKAAEAAGADALSLINTLSGMVIDIDQQKPLLGNVVGGLSGPAILPVALKMVWETAGAVEIPLLGMGGIASLKDVLQFLMAGARAIALGTVLFYDPLLPTRLTAELSTYLMQHNLADLSSLEGLARKGEQK